MAELRGDAEGVSDSRQRSARTEPPLDQRFHAPLHVLRAVAILTIVAAHTWSIPITFGEGQDPGRSVWVLWATTETLFHNSTVLFTVISGMLFTLVLRDRSWRRFFSRRIVTVALPYLLVSVLYATVRYRPAEGLELAPITDTGYWTELVRDLVTGGAAIHLWYIPVLGLLFLLTPALLRMVESDRWRALTVVLVLLPLVVSRRFPEVRPGTAVYFLGAYTAGMYVGAHYRRVLVTLRRQVPLLGLVAAGTSVAAFVLFMSDVHFVGPVSPRESMLYIQKLALAGLLLVAVQRFGSRQDIPYVVDRLADNSFTIYFFHIYPIAVMTHIGLTLFEAPHSGLLLAMLGLIQLVVVIPVLIGFTQGARRLLGRWSRPLIGA